MYLEVFRTRSDKDLKLMDDSTTYEKSQLLIDKGIICLMLDELLELANLLNDSPKSIFDMMAENPLALGEFHLIQGTSKFYVDDLVNARKHMDKAKMYYKKVFGGNHHRIDLINHIIEHFDG